MYSLRMAGLSYWLIILIQRQHGWWVSFPGMAGGSQGHAGCDGGGGVTHHMEREGGWGWRT